MKTFELVGTPREIAERSGDQTRAIKEIRNNGGIPCVLYGGKEVHHFSVNKLAIHGLIFTPDIFLVNLALGDKKFKAVKHEIQYHPVTDEILHIDFYEVDDDKAIVMEVPVELTGLALGVKAGGKLHTRMRYLKVRALYTDIPERLVISVAKMKIGDVIKVGQLSFDNLQLLNSKDAVVCAVRTVRALKPLTDEELFGEDFAEDTEGEESEEAEETAAEE